METKQATSDKSKRLIDANILVEKFLSLTLTVTGLRNGKGVILELLNKYRNGILQLINEQPTVDAAEVVRCKNCRNYKEAFGKDSGKPCGYGSCKNPCAMVGIVYDDDFCSHGERNPNG